MDDIPPAYRPSWPVSPKKIGLLVVELTRHQQLDVLLQELENCLRQNHLWSMTVPDPEALASQEPFGCDRLQFTEWLQFIFIPRLRETIAARGSLPEHCQVAPMAEVYFTQAIGSGASVIRVIGAIDALISG